MITAANGVADRWQPTIITSARQFDPVSIELLLQGFADGASANEIFLCIDLGTIDHVCQGGIMLRAFSEDDLTEFESSSLPWIFFFSHRLACSLRSKEELLSIGGTFVRD